MPYSKHTWYDDYSGGTPITAAKLNEMETGIQSASQDANTAISTLGTNLPQKGVYVGAINTNTDLVAGKIVVDNVNFAAAPKTSVYQGNYYTTLSDNRGPYWSTFAYAGTPSTTTTMYTWSAGTYAFPWVAYARVSGQHRATGGVNASVAYKIVDAGNTSLLVSPIYNGNTDYALYQAPGTGGEAGWYRAINFDGKATGAAGTALTMLFQISCAVAVESRLNVELMICPNPQG